MSLYLSALRAKVLEEIQNERIRQDSMWGEQNHEPPMWCMILGEEVGEVQKAALEWMIFKDEFPPDRYQKSNDQKKAAYREELIQVAAVAVSMVECLDRNTDA